MAIAVRDGLSRTRAVVMPRSVVMPRLDSRRWHMPLRESRAGLTPPHHHRMPAGQYAIVPGSPSG